MKNKYKALIVDDERLARNDLKSLLSEINTIQVVGEAESVSTAIEAIKKFRPDVIFLDIQMPGESGFDLLEKIKIKSKIIFVTAFDEYAIRAFEINALDYLLKPVNPERLKKAIERIGLEKKLIENNSRNLEYKDRLFLTIDGKMNFLKINSVISINSAGDYTEILTDAKKKFLTHKSMKEWEFRLPEQYFCRIHRSTIINMEYIERLEDWFNYSLRVYLKGFEKPYLMSRRYVAKLKEKLG